MLNRLELIGRVGTNSGLKEVGKTSVCNLSIATTRNVKDKSGNWEKQTVWVKVSFWGKQSESVSKYAEKGRMVYVEATVEEKKVKNEYKTYITGRSINYLTKNEAALEEPVGDVPLTMCTDTELEEIPF